ncbi:hypothetical protein E1B28_000254 [Marasmius oreades]|uniref:DUF6534 domain-containing protein n=1 Tax=Marasmius oreades TaxID=181124 RepID=A0A9P8ADY1_9AGAR|nr:uncharacterized protein E1B28_000254 [Marasmius oreades]KAG7098291.1 hypothetical protein E1B28_000254 [Marasmius oreades]
MAPVNGIPPDIAKIAGPIIITFMLGSILYGVQMLQVYIYYLSFPKDRVFVKCLVYTVFLLDTLQTALFFRDAFTIFGASFGDLASLKAAHLSGFSVPILTGLVSLMVQSFYAHQIRMLSRSNILVVIIVAIALIQFGASIWTGYLVFVINNLSNLQQRSFIQCSVWLAGSALCDTIIAIVMTIYLLRANAQTKSTQLLVARLIRLVIETGTATAAVAVIDCVLYIVVQRYPFHMLPSRILAKTYANTLMVILNSRMRITGGRGESRPHPAIIQDWSASSIRFASTFPRNATANVSVVEPAGVNLKVISSPVEYPRQAEQRIIPLTESDINRTQSTDESESTAVKVHPA